MKKIIFAISLLVVILVACSQTSNADKEKATYLESVDKYKTFTAIKIVDKETGCKYLYTDDSRKAGLVQMMDENGFPVCD